MRNSKWLWIFTAALAGSTFGLAQEKPFSFYETTPLFFSAGFDSGVPDGNRRLGSSSLLLTAPTFSLVRMAPRNDFSIFYKPEFEMFPNARGLDDFSQSGGLRWEYSMTPRLSLSVNDAFRVTDDNGRQFESSFLLPRGPYRENGLYTSLNFDLTTETRVKLRYENAFASFSAEHLSTPLFFSRMGNTVGLTVDHHLSPKAKLSVSYSYLRSRSFDTYDAAGNLILPFDPTHFATATWTYNFTPTLLLEATGGFVHNPANSYIAGGLVEKHFEHLTVAGGYNRYLTFVGTPAGDTLASTRFLPGNSISQTVSVRIEGKISPRWGVETKFLASTTSGAGPQGLRSELGEMRVNYQLREHWRLFTSVDLFHQNANVILPVLISRGRYYGGLEFTFSPTPDEISRRRNQAHDASRKDN
jgi:hypothetical protein